MTEPDSRPESSPTSGSFQSESTERNRSHNQSTDRAEKWSADFKVPTVGQESIEMLIQPLSDGNVSARWKVIDHNRARKLLRGAGVTWRLWAKKPTNWSHGISTVEAC